ncbi:Polycomb group RING finger protein 3 [Willisornis vidua]|uniref:Polycomb group RING finger protein 3 n=1 Tax=Willisornis vidua TaxID=1566151 RepID=A0ABQ9DWJ6_9PASS|nr:Polycomb group RING finger protein 3 [Willisornis vidua]
MLTRKIKLWDINAHITCRLCNGYLIDATTVTECLHTFCRSCLVKYLEENNTCPTCRIVIHQSHPLQYIGHDRTMQDIVYKLVPGLQEGETKADENLNKETSEEKQEEDNDYHRSDEQVSICLECNSSKLRGLKRKWIRCSAQATVLHLKKFIAKKLNLSSFNELDILCNEEILGKDHTLKFVVVTRWRFKDFDGWTHPLTNGITQVLGLMIQHRGNTYTLTMANKQRVIGNVSNMLWGSQDPDFHGIIKAKKMKSSSLDMPTAIFEVCKTSGGPKEKFA